MKQKVPTNMTSGTDYQRFAVFTKNVDLFTGCYFVQKVWPSKTPITLKVVSPVKANSVILSLNDK